LDPGFWDNTPAARRDSHDRAADAGWQISMYPMGPDPADDDTPLTVLMYIPPGGVLPRHSHDCCRVEVMVRGSLDLGGGVVMRPGDVHTSDPHEEYGPHTAGPEGSLTVEIFSAARGLVGRTPDGEVTRAVPTNVAK
jgi:hypothetical protein